MRNKIRRKEKTINELPYSKAVRNSFIELLKKHHLKPKKRFGQTFLTDKEVIKDALLAAELKKNDTVIEIGPGIGAITKELAKKAGRVIAVEKDRELVKILLDELKDFKNIEIIHGDILKLNPNAYRLMPNAYKIVANLPFNIAAPVIRKFLESDYPPTLMVLITQKEVAERICARPPRLRQDFGGQAKMSILAVAVQLYSKPKIVRIIKKESSWPKPKVDSAILRINPLINTDKKLINTDLFFKVVRTGFSSPRKQLKNNLKKIFRDSSSRQGGAQNDKGGVERILKLSKINPSCRAETLSVKDWIKIYRIRY